MIVTLDFIDVSLIKFFLDKMTSEPNGCCRLFFHRRLNDDRIHPFS